MECTTPQILCWEGVLPKWGVPFWSEHPNKPIWREKSGLLMSFSINIIMKYTTGFTTTKWDFWCSGTVSCICNTISTGKAPKISCLWVRNQFGYLCSYAKKKNNVSFYPINPIFFSPTLEFYFYPSNFVLNLKLNQSCRLYVWHLGDRVCIISRK